MSKASFIYKRFETIVQCQETEIMKDICNRFCTKAAKDIKNLCFMYDGEIIDIELEYKNVIKEIDKNRNKMKILVDEYIRKKEKRIKYCQTK